MVALALGAALVSSAKSQSRETSRVVEIRSYNLKPGTRDRFHQRFEQEALPMLRRWKVDVVAYGPSLHDNDSYYLMRSYPSLEERQRSEDAFYGSEEWRHGPRETILADIESYTTVVIRLDDATLRRLRKTGGSRQRESRHDSLQKEKQHEHRAVGSAGNPGRAEGAVFGRFK
jgi:hypothetical protein